MSGECLDCIPLDDCLVLCPACAAEQNAEIAPLPVFDDDDYD